MILYLLAIGSPTHAISSRSWYAFWRDRYRMKAMLISRPSACRCSCISTRTHGLIIAIDAKQAATTLTTLRTRSRPRWRIAPFVRTFPENFPGLDQMSGASPLPIAPKDISPGWTTARSGDRRYGCARGRRRFADVHAGTSTKALRTMHEKFGDRVYGRYGFVDAFNPNSGWVDSDVIGIDVGIILLSAENMRTGNVWHWFMRNGEIRARCSVWA